MFTLTIEGQYYADGKKLKKYSYQCNVPKMLAALSVVKNKIEKRKMPTIYGDFVAVRTRAIIKVESDQQGETHKTDNIAEMTIDQLKDLVINQELPIEIEEYNDVIELRKDISDAVQNLELFLKTKKDRKEIAAADKTLNDLNPDLVPVDDMMPTMPGTGGPAEPAAQGNPLAGLD